MLTTVVRKREVGLASVHPKRMLSQPLTHWAVERPQYVWDGRRLQLSINSISVGIIFSYEGCGSLSGYCIPTLHVGKHRLADPRTAFGPPVLFFFVERVHGVSVSVEFRRLMKVLLSIERPPVLVLYASVVPACLITKTPGQPL